MGQYWIPVNLDKREFVHPHTLGTGLKLWEQVASHPGTGAALLILTAAMPERRGGGDLEPDPIIGRWAGDRIAIIGDYAEDSDLKDAPVPASKIYGRCKCKQYDEVAEEGDFVDVSADVCRVIERELRGKFSGSGWRSFEEFEEGK